MPRTPKRRAARIEAEKRRQTRRHWWAGERLYEKKGKAPTRTIANMYRAEMQQFLRAKIGAEAANITAVEIGPGNAPIATACRFKDTVFVDASATMLRETTAALRGARTVHADIRNFDWPAPGNNLAIVNQVFTHLRPQERLPTLDRIAASCNRILLTDWSEKYSTGLTLRNEATGTRWTEPWSYLEPGKMRRERRMSSPAGMIHVKPGITEGPTKDPLFVSMESLAQRLVRHGFKVEVALIETREKHNRFEGTGYFTLWAVKAGANEKPRIRVKKRFKRIINLFPGA